MTTTRQILFKMKHAEQSFEDTMENEVVDNYYTSQKSKLLKDFDKMMIKYGRKILVSYYGDDLADTLITEGRQEYEALIPQLPYIGARAPRYQPNRSSKTAAIQ